MANVFAEWFDMDEEYKDMCARGLHAWILVYRWKWRRFWFYKHIFEKCVDCDATRETNR